MKSIIILSTMFLGFPYLVMGSSHDDGNALIKSVAQACKKSDFVLLNGIVTKVRFDYNVENSLIARSDVKKVIDAIENAIDLKSLSPFDQDIMSLKFTIKRILDECRLQKEKKWKPLAMRLCLSKDRPEYKAIISKYNDLSKINKILIECTKLENCGWLGCTQTLHDEKVRQRCLKMEMHPHVYAIDKGFVVKQIECKTEDEILSVLQKTEEALELFSDEYKLILQKGKKFAEKQVPDLESK